MKALQSLIGGKRRKNPNVGIAALAAMMNPGAQRQKELKNIRKAALQRTLTKLEKNIKRREKGLPPIRETKMFALPDSTGFLSKFKRKEERKKEKKGEEKKDEEEGKDEEGEKEKKEEKSIFGRKKKKDKTKGKKEEKEEEGKKPPRKTAKQIRLEEEARLKAEIETKKREEMEALRAKWPPLKNAQAVKGAKPTGRHDKERWKKFVEDQKKIIQE